MRKMTSAWIALALGVVTVGYAPAVAADDVAVLEVKGRGVEGRTPYDGGGTVRFLDLSLAAQVVHYDGGRQMPLPLEVRYEVLRPAPIVLTSRMGTEHWRLYDSSRETMSAMYSDEKIDLSKPGVFTARATKAWFNERYGPLPGAGLVAIRGHYYFLIDPKDGGPWIDVVDPPPFFDQPDVVRKLTFTLADLSRFSLAISEIQSTWEPGGPFRVRLAVTDARDRVLPVVGVPLRAAAGSWTDELAAEWGPLDEPTGWMRGTLPREVPEEIAVDGTVTLQTPDGRVERMVAATFPRGQGRLGSEAFQAAAAGYELPRNARGVIRETRAIWVSTSDVATAESIDRLVDRCRQARLNVILADVFVRNNFMARSPLMPSSKESEFDPLRTLVTKAHAAGLEVHPWFCVTYRDRAFRDWFRKKHGTDVDMHDRDGKPIPLGADVHRPEYRRFMIDLMVGVARDYDVDGIHLDYIRSMGQCYCDRCRAEFAKEFGKPLAEASEEEWIAWQRGAIGQIVQGTAEGVRKLRPKAILSAAVFADMHSGALQGQDPAGWARRGWIDVVMPMDYRMQTLQVRADERQFLSALEDDDALAAGLSLYMRSGTTALSRPAELVRQQIELVRRLGIHGYSLFAFGHLDDAQLELLRNTVNPDPAVPYFR